MDLIKHVNPLTQYSSSVTVGLHYRSLHEGPILQLTCLHPEILKSYITMDFKRYLKNTCMANVITVMSSNNIIN